MILSKPSTLVSYISKGGNLQLGEYGMKKIQTQIITLMQKLFCHTCGLLWAHDMPYNAKDFSPKLKLVEESLAMIFL